MYERDEDAPREPAAARARRLRRLSQSLTPEGPLPERDRHGRLTLDEDPPSEGGAQEAVHA